MALILDKSEEISSENSFRIGVLGDWYRGSDLGDSQDWFDGISSESLDHLIVNVEACLSDSTHERRMKAGPCLKMPTKRAKELLGKASEVLATLSNNHIFDYGQGGLKETLSALREQGIPFVGAGMSEEEAWKVARIPCVENEVVVINFSEGEDDSAARGQRAGVSGYDVARVVNSVHKEKAAGNGVVVIFHGGRERVNLPPPYVQRLFRSLAEAGADCVIGHHSHVPQPWEEWNGKVLFYSIGNSLFDYRNPSGLQATGLLPRIRFSSSAQVVSIEVDAFESKQGRLVPLVASSGLFKHLAEGACFLREEGRIEESWNIECQRQKALSKKSLLRLFVLVALTPLRVRKGAKGLRAFVGTVAHQEFLTRRLSFLLEPESNVNPSELDAYLSRKNIERL
ncbi:MAG: CapA family protein [Roseibacillus sp.]